MTTLLEAIANIEGRFASGNSIPVERAYMTRAEWDAFCDVIRMVTSDYAAWTPTSKNIDALPLPVRDFIVRLKTNVDPAGELRRAMVWQMKAEALQAMVDEAPIKEIDGKRYRLIEVTDERN